MKTLCVLLLVLLLSVPASGAPLLAPEAGRITDQAIAGDLQTLTGLQQRLADLNSVGTVPVGVYHFAKAQAWLDMAMDTYVMNDRSRVVEDAAREAWLLIDLLERKERNLPLATPILPTSKVVRQDLWDLAARFKQDPRFPCAEDTVAQLEVQLVWTGHEENQLGWRHAKPYLQAAERLAREARRQMEACSSGTAVALTADQPTLQPPTAAPVPAPDTAAAAPPAAMAPAVSATAPASLREICSGYCPEQAVATPQSQAASQAPAGAPSSEPLPDRIHFAFDRYRLSPKSTALLDRVASVLRNEPAVTVAILGHADERGHRVYNLALSKQRAEVVRSYLVAAGVTRDRLTVKALSSSCPLVNGRDGVSFARNRRVELIFDGIAPGRVVQQDEDLQVEKP